MNRNAYKNYPPLGIYVHIPYCLTKCPYCDFNSYGTDGNFPEQRYIDALLKEIESWSEVLEGKEISTVFFGGGTPSLFDPRSIDSVMEFLGSLASVLPTAEVTLEVNPRTVDVSRLREFAVAGVNRISVGIQSFSERKLDFYRRFASPDDCMRAISDVCDAGFSNFNLDLIYGSLGETPQELENDLRVALGFSPTHISAYCLTIEPGTEFATLYRMGKLRLPDDSVLAEYMKTARNILERANYLNYEISNFALPGYECRHNLIYWNCHDYLGIGAGAHSHMRGLAQWGRRWSNTKNPELYMKYIENRGSAVSLSRDLSRQESLEDMLLMGLRLFRGLDLCEVVKRFGCQLDRNVLGYLESDGFILTKGGYIRVTNKGKIFTDELIARVTGAFCLDSEVSA